MNDSHNFRMRLRAHEPLLGTMLTLPLAALGEILAEAGMDWLFVDMEHGALDLHDVEQITQAVNHRCPCVVRVPTNEAMWIGKVLDLGVSGIIVPQINRAADAEKAVFAAKYPPAGGRGVGYGRAARYGSNIGGYLKTANDDAALILQVETRDAVQNVREIASVPGVDALLIGPNDLAASLGHLGDLEHPDVPVAIEQVLGIANELKMPICRLCGTAEQARRAQAEGFTFALVSTDSMLLFTAAHELVRTFKSGG